MARLRLSTPRVHGLCAGALQAVSARLEADEWLGGRESEAYPPRVCQVIAETHLRHASSLQEDGHEADPALLAQAVAALSPGYDPYLCDAKGTMMTNDYWKQIG